MKISDEIRNRFSIDHCGSGLLVSNSECGRLLALADRIDSEMVELPRDRDGVPINLMDEVQLNGKNGFVTRIDYHINGYRDVTFLADGECIVCTETELAELTHERPDSLERIATEMDEIVDTARSANDSCEKLADIADRIRKLANKEEQR